MVMDEETRPKNPDDDLGLACDHINAVIDRDNWKRRTIYLANKLNEYIGGNSEYWIEKSKEAMK